MLRRTWLQYLTPSLLSLNDRPFRSEYSPQSWALSLPYTSRILTQFYATTAQYKWSIFTLFLSSNCTSRSPLGSSHNPLDSYHRSSCMARTRFPKASKETVDRSTQRHSLRDDCTSHRTWAPCNSQLRSSKSCTASGFYKAVRYWGFAWMTRSSGSRRLSFCSWSESCSEQAKPIHPRFLLRTRRIHQISSLVRTASTPQSC